MEGLFDMQLTVNGKARTVADDATITRLLEELQINPLRVAIQLNERIIKRELYERTPLQAGDTLEIITFMAGGSS